MDTVTVAREALSLRTGSREEIRDKQINVKSAKVSAGLSEISVQCDACHTCHSEVAFSLFILLLLTRLANDCES